MAKGKKQQAKLAYKKMTQGEEDSSTTKLLALSGGHLIGQYPAERTRCGLRVNASGGTSQGWRYGTEAEIRCGACRETA